MKVGEHVSAHVRALNFIGGVPRQIVPDNPKVGW